MCPRWSSSSCCGWVGWVRPAIDGPAVGGFDRCVLRWPLGPAVDGPSSLLPWGAFPFAPAAIWLWLDFLGTHKRASLLPESLCPRRRACLFFSFSLIRPVLVPTSTFSYIFILGLCTGHPLLPEGLSRCSRDPAAPPSPLRPLVAHRRALRPGGRGLRVPLAPFLSSAAGLVLSSGWRGDGSGLEGRDPGKETQRPFCSPSATPPADLWVSLCMSPGFQEGELQTDRFPRQRFCSEEFRLTSTFSMEAGLSLSLPTLDLPMAQVPQLPPPLSSESWRTPRDPTGACWPPLYISHLLSF